MPKRQTNNLKWSAELLSITDGTDENDRPAKVYSKVRDLKYNNIGVTATDKFTTKDTNEIMKKIECRIDRNVETDQKLYAIKIDKRIYEIERIYVREEDRVMEVSLAYAN